MTSVNDKLMHKGSCNVPTFSYDASGNVTGLMGPNGALIDIGIDAPNGFLASAHGLQFNAVNTAGTTLATWTGGTGTLTLTREITLEGLPTLKIDMPSACTRLEIGVTSGATVPSNWDVAPNRTFGYPVYIVDRTPLTTIQVFVGDASYTAYDLLTADIAANEPWNGWHFIRYLDGWPGESNSSKTGTLTAGNVNQTKLRINKTAGTAATVYLSWGGVMPREQAKILWTADDGYDEWYSWLMPTATLYGIPWALGFDRYYAGSAGFMTEAQIRLMAADTTGLFEMYSHGYQNLGVSDIGATAYQLNDDTTWSWLRSLGVRNNRVYHPWVKGSYTDESIGLMNAAGIKIGRTVDGAGTLGRAFKPSIDNIKRPLNNLRAPIGLSLEAGYTLANGKTAIDQVISTGGTLIIMAHEFVTSGPTGLQWTQSDTQLLMEYAKAKERAGLVENIRASELASQIITP